jgi:nucleotide-binding universal stress UspA family protein
MIPSLAIETAQRISAKSIDHEQLTTAAQRFVQHALPEGVAFDLALQDAPDVHREILSEAVARKADLIVMGTHGRSGFERLVLGSITEKVVRKASCPVMVVPRDARHAVAAGDVAFDRIVCAVDFSDSSITALSYALSLAEESDAHLTVLHVMELPIELDDAVIPGREALTASVRNDALKRLSALVPDSARIYSQMQTSVVAGIPHQEILRFAHEQRSDLIAMGSEGRGAIDQMLFGSNTHHVVRTAPCPVLAVRAQ